MSEYPFMPGCLFIHWLKTPPLVRFLSGAGGSGGGPFRVPPAAPAPGGTLLPGGGTYAPLVEEPRNDVVSIQVHLIPKRRVAVDFWGKRVLHVRLPILFRYLLRPAGLVDARVGE